MLEVVNTRFPLAASVLMFDLVMTGCGSGNSSHTASPTSSPTSAASATTATATTGAPTCPTMAQADAALGVAYSGPNAYAPQQRAAGSPASTPGYCRRWWKSWCHDIWPRNLGNLSPGRSPTRIEATGMQNSPASATAPMA